MKECSHTVYEINGEFENVILIFFLQNVLERSTLKINQFHWLYILNLLQIFTLRLYLFEIKNILGKLINCLLNSIQI